MATNSERRPRLAISNICWDRELDSQIASEMLSRGVRGVEIAPAKIGPVAELTPAQLGGYRKFWSDHGIKIIAMQALLFGRSDLAIFGEDRKRAETLDYLKVITDIGAAVGAEVLVFGSPKNRLIGNKDISEAWPIALEFFGAAGAYAASAGTCICIEANPKEYGCDFITRSFEAAQLVDAVDSPGFGLHLDVGGMILSSEDPLATIEELAPRAKHFHISAPNLEPIHKQHSIDYAAILRTLNATAFEGWASVEMKPQPDNPADLVSSALAYVSRIIDTL